MSRRTYTSAMVGLACAGILTAVQRPAAQEPAHPRGGCYGAVIRALATNGYQPGDFDDFRAVQDQVRSACAAVEAQGQRFTVEIDGVTVGGIVVVRLIPEE